MTDAARRYSPWVSDAVRGHLQGLLDAADAENVEQYRDRMHALGRDLGKELAHQLPPIGNVIVVCTVEDADFLARGVLEELEHGRRAHVFCYWNERDAERDTAPIISRYEEPVDASQVSAVVVVKSVISSACVVRTNLIEVTEKLGRNVPVFVLAPVMHKDAAKKLAREFPAAVSQRFRYVTCAIDAEKVGEMIRPGIGGSVYELLGLGDKHTKNRVRPRIVADRSRLFAPTQ